MATTCEIIIHGPEPHGRKTSMDHKTLTNDLISIRITLSQALQEVKNEEEAVALEIFLRATLRTATLALNLLSPGMEED